MKIQGSETPMLVLAVGVAMVLAACSGRDADPASRHAGASTPATAQPVEAPRTLASAVEGEWRSNENLSKDPFRNPGQVLEFFGVSDASKVGLFGDHSLFYAEILAPFLRQRGQLVLLSNDPVALQSRLGDRPGVFDGTAVEALLRPGASSPESELDTALVLGGVDDAVRAQSANVMFQSLYSRLRNGGVLGIVQPRSGGTLPTDGGDGYLSEKQVIFLGELAGFQLVEWSEISSNPNDERDGSLTTEGTGNREEPDRMTLKFVKRPRKDG